MSGHDHKHWTDDALIEAVYGLQEIDATVRECASCFGRWNEIQAKHAVLAAEPEVSSEFLAAQRRKIYERLEHPERKSLGWVPAMVAAGLAVAGVFMYQQRVPVRTQPAETLTQTNDAQVFADVAEAYSDLYSMDQSFEPSAATPIRALFESAQAEEGSAKQ
jgi:hypothetical protein